MNKHIDRLIDRVKLCTDDVKRNTRLIKCYTEILEIVLSECKYTILNSNSDYTSLVVNIYGMDLYLVFDDATPNPLFDKPQEIYRCGEYFKYLIHLNRFADGFTDKLLHQIADVVYKIDDVKKDDRFWVSEEIFDVCMRINDLSMRWSPLEVDKGV